MKYFFMALIAVFSMNVFALNGPVVESVERNTFIDPACPVCDGGVEVTETVFTFTEEWCRSDIDSNAYEIVLGETTGMIGMPRPTVTIQVKGQMADCMGPTRPVTFRLSTDELVEGERYILTNPSVIR